MAPYVPLSSTDAPARVLARLLRVGDDDFVRDAYRALLGRDPDPKGSREYAGQLLAGAPRLQLLASLARSVEARESGPGRALATLVLARALRSEATPDSLHALLALDDEEFVIGAYRAVLGRDPDANGGAYYVNVVRGGDPKVDVLATLRQSDEGARRAREWQEGSSPRLALLSEIDRAIGAQRWARLPVVGTVLAALLALEPYSPSARRARRTASLAARTANALGLGDVELGFEQDESAGSPPQAPAADRSPDIRISRHADVAAKLMTLPAAFRDPSPRA